MTEAATGAVAIEFSEYLGPRCTNNEAEYAAVIFGVRAALRMGVRRLQVRSDSQLLVQQLRGAYRVKAPHLLALRDEARALGQRFAAFDVQHVPREENVVADALANAALDAQQLAGAGDRS